MAAARTQHGGRRLRGPPRAHAPCHAEGAEGAAPGAAAMAAPPPPAGPQGPGPHRPAASLRSCPPALRHPGTALGPGPPALHRPGTAAGHAVSPGVHLQGGQGALRAPPLAWPGVALFFVLNLQRLNQSGRALWRVQVRALCWRRMFGVL